MFNEVVFFFLKYYKIRVLVIGYWEYSFIGFEKILYDLYEEVERKEEVMKLLTLFEIIISYYPSIKPVCIQKN